MLKISQICTVRVSFKVRSVLLVLSYLSFALFCLFASILEMQEFQIHLVLSLLRLGISHFSRDMRVFLIGNGNQTQSMYRHTQWCAKTVALKHSYLGASPAVITRV